MNNQKSYLRLAIHSIRNNRQFYFPYMGAAAFTVMIYYLLRSLSCDPMMEQMQGGPIIAEMLGMGSSIAAVFAVLFLFYTNRFLTKRRKKELGLYNILGMEKKHIAGIIAFEMMITGGFSIVAGILGGIVSNKLAYLLITKFMKENAVLGFFVSSSVVGMTVWLFLGIFCMAYGNAIFQLHLSSPIELLHGEVWGEKEPRTSKLLAVLGVLCLLGGYGIALTCKEPIETVGLFLAAVLLVMFATYLLFTAGSVALLKWLKGRKSYYYQTAHFISISGMLYRMKQNAAGLSAICILSTMVLVTIASSLSLMLSIDTNIKERNLCDIAIYSKEGTPEENHKQESVIEELLSEKQAVVTEQFQYTYKELLVSQIEGNFYREDVYKWDPAKKFTNLVILPEYAYSQTSKDLDNGTVLVIGAEESYPYSYIQIDGQTFKVRKAEWKQRIKGLTNAEFYMIMNEQDLDSFIEQTGLQMQRYKGMNLKQNQIEQLKLADELQVRFDQQGMDGRVQSRSYIEAEFKGLYGSILFLGFFLGAVFLVATVLMIYYKQISEGYEDAKRYEIMQKVGMSQEEVKQSIQSQIRTVFFLPLLMSGMHLLFCLPVLAKILSILGLFQVSLLWYSAAGCYLIFSVLYLCVFAATSRTYYRIVKK